MTQNDLHRFLIKMNNEAIKAHPAVTNIGCIGRCEFRVRVLEDHITHCENNGQDVPTKLRSELRAWRNALADHVSDFLMLGEGE